MQHFGPHRLHSQHIFLKTALSMAFVNLRPVVPGHVLVAPLRPVRRLAEMTVEETQDLWLTVRRICPALQQLHGANSLTVSVQDGADAGQTVPHVHVHMLPRRPGDFARNDDVYYELDSPATRRQDRTIEEMSQEAEQLRALFAH